jgi:hypothetical protein
MYGDMFDNTAPRKTKEVSRGEKVPALVCNVYLLTRARAGPLLLVLRVHNALFHQG